MPDPEFPTTDTRRTEPFCSTGSAPSERALWQTSLLTLCASRPPEPSVAHLTRPGSPRPTHRRECHPASFLREVGLPTDHDPEITLGLHPAPVGTADENPERSRERPRDFGYIASRVGCFQSPVCGRLRSSMEPTQQEGAGRQQQHGADEWKTRSSSYDLAPPAGDATLNRGAHSRGPGHNWKTTAAIQRDHGAPMTDALSECELSLENARIGAAGSPLRQRRLTERPRGRAWPASRIPEVVPDPDGAGPPAKRVPTPTLRHVRRSRGWRPPAPRAVGPQPPHGCGRTRPASP